MEQVDFALSKINGDVSILNYYGAEESTIQKSEAKSLAQDRNSWVLAEGRDFQNFYRENGFDAVLAKDNGDKYIAVFDPTQIKSATDNSGAFSADNDSILFQSSVVNELPDGVRGVL